MFGFRKKYEKNVERDNEFLKEYSGKVNGLILFAEENEKVKTELKALQDDFQYCVASPDPKAIFDKEYAEKWKAKYKEIVLELKERYGNVKFLLITTVLMHDPRWDEVLDEIKEELGDYVYRYRFNRNGAATPGHPRATEQTEMAVELEQFIKANML